MMAPHLPVQMWAIHDKALNTYSMPYSTHLEARLMRDMDLAHLGPTQRQAQFPVVPVNITVSPRPYNAGEIAQQPTLFPAHEVHHARHQTHA